MTTPDDEFRTVGLPAGNRRKLAQDIERELKGDAGTPPREIPGRAAVPAPPNRPSSGQGPSAPQPPHRNDPASESFATIPPVPGLKKRPASGSPPGPSEPPSASAGTAPPAFGGSWGTGPAPSPVQPVDVAAQWGFEDHSPEPFNPWADSEPAAPAPPASTPAPPPGAGLPTGGDATRVAPQGDWEQGYGTFATPAPPKASPVARPPASAPPPPQGHSPSHGTGRPQPAFSRPHAGGESSLHQTMVPGAGLAAGKSTLLTLQFYNTNLRRWSDLGAVQGSVLDIGRSTFQDWNPNADDLARAHLRLMIDEGRLFVEPLPSLNGAYIKLKHNTPVELAPGARFRIGRHVLAFRPGEDPSSRLTPLRSSEGEVFQSRVLAAQGFIDLIGPDGEAYLSYPLTKTEQPGTRIGRGGASCDLALNDDWVSGEHARVYFANGSCFLVDPRSTNGTFLQVHGMVEIEPGSALRPDAGDIVAVGGFMIRVVEERP